MKYKLSFIIGIVVVLLAACKKDNFDPPESWITGKVVYNNLPLGVRSNGVQLELWQRGFANFSKIPVYVAQDGTFSANVFDGDYKLTRLKGNGPWADNTDTIDVSVRGSAVVDVPVDPFFIIRNETFSRTGTTINTSFNLQRVNTSRALEAVRLYIGATTIVDQNNNAANAQKAASAVTDLTQPVTLSLNVPASLANRDYVFVRVGVKTSGVGEWLYSMPQKIALK
jgi:hypothetical protein